MIVGAIPLFVLEDDHAVGGHLKLPAFVRHHVFGAHVALKMLFFQLAVPNGLDRLVIGIGSECHHTSSCNELLHFNFF